MSACGQSYASATNHLRLISFCSQIVQFIDQRCNFFLFSCNSLLRHILSCLLGLTMINLVSSTMAGYIICLAARFFLSKKSYKLNKEIYLKKKRLAKCSPEQQIRRIKGGNWRQQWCAALPFWCENQRCGRRLLPVKVLGNSGMLSPVNQQYAFPPTAGHLNRVASVLRKVSLGTCFLCVTSGYFARHRYKSPNFPDIKWTLVTSFPLCVPPLSLWYSD